MKPSRSLVLQQLLATISAESSGGTAMIVDAR